MKSKRIPKRENVFIEKIKRLDDRWSNYSELLMLVDTNAGFAEMWKYQTYVIQTDAVFALMYSYSNQHPDVGHKVIRKNGQLIFSAQVLRKAFYLRFFIILIQSSGDKLAQVLRCALGITKWKTKKHHPANKDADEKNTSLVQLRKHMALTLEEERSLPDREQFNNIWRKIENYLNDDAVKTILTQANALKHRWQLFYRGEGLHPLRPKIEDVKDADGRVVGKKLPIGAFTYGVNLDEHIRLSLRVNNLFVDMANGILDQLDFERYFEIRSGKRVLRRKKTSSAY